MLNRFVRATALLVALVGCATTELPTTDARFTADIFARTCLQAAIQGGIQRSTFEGAEGFEKSNRPLPGPRTIVFDGPESTIGVAQFFPGSVPSKDEPVLRPLPDTMSEEIEPEPIPQSRTCAVYAQISDLVELHDATDAAIENVLPGQDFAPTVEQASVRRIGLRDGRELSVSSSRLGPGGGMLNPIPGNVVIIVRQTLP